MSTFAERLAKHTVEVERAALIELLDAAIDDARREGFTDRVRYSFRALTTHVDLVRMAIGREIGEPRPID